ncbi:MAG: hypothetical protein U0P45_01780 [Acidimicrobiales bacterium]
MANKRDTSKQKRARQNRAQREALKARTTAASTPAEARRSSTATPDRSAPAKQEKRGFFAPDPNRPPRPGDTPVDLATLEGNWFAKRMQVPGGRQVMTGLLMAIVLAITGVIGKVKAEDWTQENNHLVPMTERYGALSAVLVGVPVVLMLIATVLTLHPKHRLIWWAITFLMTAWVVATINITGIFFLLPTGFLYYAGRRAARIEGPLPSKRRAAAAGAAETTDDGVEVAPEG